MTTAFASRRSLEIWAAWVVFALLLMPLVGRYEWLFIACVAGSALVLSMLTGTGHSESTEASAATDLRVLAILYVGVVAAMRLAFVVFGTDHIPGLFLSFAAALLLGVVGPVVHIVWTKNGGLHDLGLTRDNWQITAALASVFAATQFTITLWGYDLPAPVDWVPLLVMALVVGIFESVFFRGFIQNQLEARFGPRVGIGGAALLYGVYHVGYGMGLTDIAFLTGLGTIYGIAFSLVRNVLVLWPLLTPLGSFYAQLTSGSIELPWASIMGFADIAMLMLVTFWIGHHHDKKRKATMTRWPPGERHMLRT